MDSRDEFYLLANGSLVAPFLFEHALGSDEFCMDVFPDTDNGDVVVLPLVCFPPPDGPKRTGLQFVLYPIGEQPCRKTGSGAEHGHGHPICTPRVSEFPAEPKGIGSGHFRLTRLLADKALRHALSSGRNAPALPRAFIPALYQEHKRNALGHSH